MIAETANARLSGPVETDTPLQATAREAGWALLTHVDSFPAERREQISAICYRLAFCLDEGAGGNEAKRSHPNPSPSPEPVKDQAEQGVEAVAWEHPEASGWQCIYVQMPVNRFGQGPADPDETDRVEHQVWDATTNCTICTARDETTARMIVAAWNTCFAAQPSKGAGND